MTKEYFRRYRAIQRAKKRGFNLDLALQCYNEMRGRGIAADDARSAIYSAVRDGLFGTLGNCGR